MGHLSLNDSQLGAQIVEDSKMLHHQSVRCRSGQVDGQADQVVTVGKVVENLAHEELMG